MTSSSGGGSGCSLRGKRLLKELEDQLEDIKGRPASAGRLAEEQGE